MAHYDVCGRNRLCFAMMWFSSTPAHEARFREAGEVATCDWLTQWRLQKVGAEKNQNLASRNK